MGLILASASPRRREILALAGYQFSVVTADTNEDIDRALPPQRLVMELAKRKALAVSALHPYDMTVGADTIVFLKDRILGKPTDEDDAKRMLRLLSGRWHAVYTGVCIASGERMLKTFYDKTLVRFYPLSEDDISRYVATGDPMDKAGAYAVQGESCVFIKGIIGDFYNVMGFPAAKFRREEKKLIRQ